MSDNRKGRILIVDDELVVRDSLNRMFEDEGYETRAAGSAREALEDLNAGDYDLALLDIRMPGMDGMDLHARLHEIDPDLMVIIMTGYATVETAVQGLKKGAWDYIVKPVDPDELIHLVTKAIEHRGTRREVVRLRENMQEIFPKTELVGRSPAMKRVAELVEMVAPSDATVLITGESGTGKEVVARAIHSNSPRRHMPMVVIHCGALTETLLESELFGHERGAFTGAQFLRKGKFEIADGGTVFLDEIGDISLKTQTDLLRVLQEREIVRVGGNQTIHVDFRVVAATNKNLELLIEEGKFRPDLFYRLNVFHIELPPLRERREDIPPLVNHFVQKFSLAMNKKITCVSPAAMNLLQQYPWPGNVRELENAVERAMVVAQEPELREQDFTLKTRNGNSVTGSRSLEDVEKDHILRVLENCGGNHTRTAEVLGIDRVTLHHKLKKFGWNRKEKEQLAISD